MPAFLLRKSVNITSEVPPFLLRSSKPQQIIRNGKPGPSPVLALLHKAEFFPLPQLLVSLMMRTHFSTRSPLPVGQCFFTLCHSKQLIGFSRLFQANYRYSQTTPSSLGQQKMALNNNPNSSIWWGNPPEVTATAWFRSHIPKACWLNGRVAGLACAWPQKLTACFSSCAG